MPPGPWPPAEQYAVEPAGRVRALCFLGLYKGEEGGLIFVKALLLRVTFRIPRRIGLFE